MHLDDLLDSQLALPSIPRVIAVVLAELSREDPDLRRISHDVNTDPGLTARLLRLANSAQFQLSTRIGTVSEALAVLGLDQVRTLAMAAGVAGVFKRVPGMDMPQYWRYSLDVAKLARRLAREVRSNPATAFTAGLIHATGELVMHLGMPEQMHFLNDQAQPLSSRRARAERNLLGYSYAEVGGGFAKKWDFPEAIVDAIAHQLVPFDEGVYEPLAGIVHLAVWRVRAHIDRLDEGHMADAFPDTVALALGIDFDHVLTEEAVEWTTGTEAAGLI
ncbi:MAG: HDOD domain-containing protein [Burkholderiales bacterium]|nr:HDOD domain-containing protein [Burkholderiales bacterium]